MKKIDVSKLLEKAEQFQVLSFFQEVLDFVVDVKPLIDSINKTLDENVKKMPTATQKLNKVSEATEFATTEILNLVDALLLKKDNLLKEIFRLYEVEIKERKYVENKLLAIKESLQGKANDSIIKELQDTIDFVSKEPFHSDSEAALLLPESVASFNDDLTAIMMSLQVQDITSQQIAAVNHLLDAIRLKLSKMISLLSSSEIMSHANAAEESQIKEVNGGRTVAFDPNAIEGIFEKEKRQKDVDNFIEMISKGISPEEADSDLPSEKEIKNSISADISESSNAVAGEEVSQDDIDAMFGASAGAVAGEEVSQDDIDAMFGVSAGAVESEEVSQDDIDAMFGASAGAVESEEVSQDDIDAMFGN
ncbi:MAG: hypothetical protein GX121_10015 [Ignavibacteria bacterium]|nr:hypothetical protein [Ignavibacteria bacterium]